MSVPIPEDLVALAVDASKKDQEAVEIAAKKIFELGRLSALASISGPPILPEPLDYHELADKPSLIQESERSVIANLRFALGLKERRRIDKEITDILVGSESVLKFLDESEKRIEEKIQAIESKEVASLRARLKSIEQERKATLKVVDYLSKRARELCGD